MKPQRPSQVAKPQSFAEITFISYYVNGAICWNFILFTNNRRILEVGHKCETTLSLANFKVHVFKWPLNARCYLQSSQSKSVSLATFEFANFRYIKLSIFNPFFKTIYIIVFTIKYMLFLIYNTIYIVQNIQHTINHCKYCSVYIAIYILFYIYYSIY